MALNRRLPYRYYIFLDDDVTFSFSKLLYYAWITVHESYNGNERIRNKIQNKGT